MNSLILVACTKSNDPWCSSFARPKAMGFLTRSCWSTPGSDFWPSSVTIVTGSLVVSDPAAGYIVEHLSLDTRAAAAECADGETVESFSPSTIPLLAGIDFDRAQKKNI
jgi:hypothetical protein